MKKYVSIPIVWFINFDNTYDILIGYDELVRDDSIDIPDCFVISPRYVYKNSYFVDIDERVYRAEYKYLFEDDGYTLVDTPEEKSEFYKDTINKKLPYHKIERPNFEFEAEDDESAKKIFRERIEKLKETYAEEEKWYKD